MALCGVLAAAPSSPAGEAPSFKSGVEVVNLNVTVTDSRNHLMGNLTSQDFLVQHRIQLLERRLRAEAGIVDQSPCLHLGWRMRGPPV